MGKNWRKLYGLKETFVCPYCLKTLPVEFATRDHKNPYSRFKDNSPKNIVIACLWCNTEKGALTAEEYKEWKRLEILRHGGKSR